MKQTAKLRKYIKDGVEHTADITINNAKLNWVFLENPRPEGTYGGGRYEAQIIVEDMDVWNKFTEYFNEVYEKAVTEKWNNRRPDVAAKNALGHQAQLNVPFRPIKLDENGNKPEGEENAIAYINVRSNKQPDLFMNLPGQPEGIRVAGEGDEQQFYSGMIADVIFSLSAYAKGKTSSIDGISAWVNAVSKVGVGTPYGGSGAGNYMNMLAGDTGNANALRTPVAPTTPVTPAVTTVGIAPAPTTTASIPTPVAPTQAATPGLGINLTPTPGAITEPEVAPTQAATTLQDLIKGI